MGLLRDLLAGVPVDFGHLGTLRLSVDIFAFISRVVTSPLGPSALSHPSSEGETSSDLNTTSRTSGK